MALVKALVCATAIAMLATLSAAQDGKCPCPKGQCCSKNGFCGTGDPYCGKNNCASQCPSCFPGDATVEVLGGKHKHMNELSIGDQVAAAKDGKNTIFEPIYAFGHKNPTALMDFLKIEMEATDGSGQKQSLEVTSLHFIPLSDGYKRAGDIKLGDATIATTNTSTMSFFKVTSITPITNVGYYNPFTMSGTIIVDGVLASVHSEWFLDSTFDALGITEYLPMAYQSILYPARVLYNLLGGNAYKSIYDKLDSKIDIAEVGTDYGGIIFGIATTSAIGILAYNNLKKKM